MNHGLPYKPYIDGLRAVAVLGVVLNHFKPSVLLGGFIGVDVFFVISGFLLSGAILRGLDRGDFSLASFYVRRIRRIIPAASFALILVIVAGFFVLLPQELHRLSLSALYTVLFAANFFFYANVDYFSPAADQMPLLHYWSLGVEEQFYLIFPLAIIIIRKIWPSSVVYAVIYLCILSFSASIIILSRDQTAAFYILPFRVTLPL